MKRLPGICHHDRPFAEADDVGDFLRKAASEATGFDPCQHVDEARAQLEENGGAENVIRNVERRLARGAK